MQSWIPSGVGLFDIQPTRGGLIYTGSHNTGGFAQSPEVVHAVAAALVGAAIQCTGCTIHGAASGSYVNLHAKIRNEQHL